jgi:hypothetical protein
MTKLVALHCVAWLSTAMVAVPAVAQVVTKTDHYALTLEGYANLTTGFGAGLGSEDVTREGDLRADVAVRALGQLHLPHKGDLGLRLVVESSPEDSARLAEASVLLIGKSGRLEIGERQGLPDVLTGYAPNNFQFTGAEYGPASGPSLDPGGGLQQTFLAPALARQVNELAVLGFAASLFDDRSAKVLYVSPKRRGFIGGLSFAPDADDGRYGELVQAGLVHERYWDENELRLGGSYTYAQARLDDPMAAARADLQSANLGATLILNYDLMLGISATWNGHSGLEQLAIGDESSAYGATASVNFNRGRWTAGGYVQWAAAEGDVQTTGNDRLATMEMGVSYRINTKVRFYGVWHYLDFADEGGATRADRTAGGLMLLGVRATL